jgi:DNA-binding PadR family transcriptional regulator
VKIMARHLGELEQLLLFALLRLGSTAHGGSIREVVHERTGRRLSPGAIYTALDRLERRGLVASRLGDPTPERGGKRKRLYRLRPAGVAALRGMQSMLASMARGLKPRLEES